MATIFLMTTLKRDPFASITKACDVSSFCNDITFNYIINGGKLSLSNERIYWTA